jgi:hypothetical protein
MSNKQQRKYAIPKMPKEFIGVFNKKNPYANTTARQWTEEEKQWCIEMYESGYTLEDIAISTGRSNTSIQIKMKRLQKEPQIRTYNQKHIIDKYSINHMFAHLIRPNTILDLCCGTENFWNILSEESECPLQFEVLTNDKNKNIQADMHKDAPLAIAELYSKNMKFDLIDIDTFGSPYDSIDLAIRIAKKGLILTLGELGHKRFKRLDFVRDHYRITSLKDFTTENIIKEIQRMARCHKKQLIPIVIREYKGISRVWFKIEKLKKTEQWEKL